MPRIGPRRTIIIIIITDAQEQSTRSSAMHTIKARVDVDGHWSLRTVAAPSSEWECHLVGGCHHPTWEPAEKSRLQLVLHNFAL